MTTTPSPLIPVIVSGGAGSRLWPLSREGHPKPFIRLADGESLLQKTFLRAAALPGVQRVLTVTNRDFYFQSADEYRADRGVRDVDLRHFPRALYVPCAGDRYEPRFRRHLSRIFG